MNFTTSKGAINQLFLVFFGEHFLNTLLARSMLRHTQNHRLASLFVKLMATIGTLEDTLLVLHQLF